ncbi:MAG: hypothetical protein P4M14_13610 [Gammaproteobacteria bacterium]|nr:hypothetical protein [Gammaproteobacteria bacterium]
MAAPTTLLDNMLTSVLKEILREETGIEVKKEEQELILAIAKEMIQKNPELGEFSKKTMMFADKRELFKQHLLAATAVAMFIEMHELQKDCKKLFEKIMDPDVSPADKNVMKEQLRMVLGRLNRLDPNKTRQDKMSELLKDENFIDKLIQMQKDLKAEKDSPENPSPTLEESKALQLELQGMVDKELETTLRNLYGCDPRIAGAIAFPVMSVIGDYAGIPDQFAAISSAANIHRLSGDLDSAGIDEHMTRVENANKAREEVTQAAETGELDNAAYQSAQSAPTLEP